MLQILLATVASQINRTPIKAKKPIRYIGPVVYSNLPPPVVIFPPAPEVPKGPYTSPPRPVQFVPFPYNELPVLIYKSTHNPPIHVVNQNNKLTSQNSVGESSPYHKDYGSDNNGDLLAEGSETIETRASTKSPFLSLFEQKPIYIESPPPPKPIYVSPSRNTVRRQKGMYPPGVVHGRPNNVQGDLDTSDSKIAIKTLASPHFRLTKAVVLNKRPFFESPKKDYFGDFLSSLFGGITTTTSNFNRLFRLRLPTPKPMISSLRERVKQYKLRKILGLKSPKFHYLSGYGNQAVDPDYASLLSEEVTQSFIDEIGNFAKHGIVKYTTKKPMFPEGKPPRPVESNFEHLTYTRKVLPTTTTTTMTPMTTTTTTTTTASPIHNKKPPIIIFQGIRPPIYVYRKPVSQIYDDTEVIKPPLPQYKPPQALHEQPPPRYKTLPFAPFSPFSKSDDNNNRKSLIISTDNDDKTWQPLSQGKEESTGDIIVDVTNHKMDSPEKK